MESRPSQLSLLAEKVVPENLPHEERLPEERNCPVPRSQPVVEHGKRESVVSQKRDDIKNATVAAEVGIARITETSDDGCVAPESAQVDAREMAPMMQHYLAMKKQYPEHLMLFQVGDFYEIFFEDARLASEALSIRLTSRDRDQPNPIPMCGVPIHALDNYLPRLLQAGFSCVLISQTEDAKNKKGMVQREVTRIVTPGVRYEGDGLDEKQFNFLAAAFLGPRGVGAISYVDVSTGWLRIQELEGIDDLIEVLRRVRPAELILPSLLSGVAVDRSARWFREGRRVADELSTRLAFRPFEAVNRESVMAHLRESLLSPEQELEGAKDDLAKLSPEALQALQAVLLYVEDISFGKAPKLSQLSVEVNGRAVMLDAATRRNLELSETRIDGEKKNSLLGHINYAKSAMGARLLNEWIVNPSSNLREICARHDAVSEFVSNGEALQVLRESLTAVRDIDRLVSRITGFRASPRDLASLRDSIRVFPKIGELLEVFQSPLLSQLRERFDTLPDVFVKLEGALVDEPPLRVNEGGIFRDGFHEQIDSLRRIGSEGNSWLLELERRERQATGISGLKVKFNNVFGYFLEVSKAHLDKIPKHYERRQTLTNAERFILPELKEYEASLLSAQARQFELERELFNELRSWVADVAGRIQISARCLSVLDVLGAFAFLATKHGYSRPEMNEGSTSIIHGGRHPVVERVIGFHNFIPNDALLDTEKRRFAILTGPNMGGKSTYLRQVGLIQLLAQAGSFVPAAKAQLGVVDRIFTRIGAADDLARGDSTFMVEMREAATILKKAEPRSLVLIDEIGRGTATDDGLAIATAIAEWLHDRVCCRTLFATHFHELTHLCETKEGAFCLAVGVIEEGLEIAFTHRIEEKAASRSYGVEVARLAGLPEELLIRAYELLSAAQDSKVAKIIGKPAAFPEQKTAEKQSALERAITVEREAIGKVKERLQRLELNSLTPIEALVQLSELKQFVDGYKK